MSQIVLPCRSWRPKHIALQTAEIQMRWRIMRWLYTVCHYIFKLWWRSLFSNNGSVQIQIWKSPHQKRVSWTFMVCIFPASILFKSIAGRYRPVSYPDGPITARYRFIKNAYWVITCSVFFVCFFFFVFFFFFLFFFFSSSSHYWGSTIQIQGWRREC